MNFSLYFRRIAIEASGVDLIYLQLDLIQDSSKSRQESFFHSFKSGVGDVFSSIATPHFREFLVNARKSRCRGVPTNKCVIWTSESLERLKFRARFRAASHK
jgi:hypothetical protein